MTTPNKEMIKQLCELGIPDWKTARWLMTVTNALDIQAGSIEAVQAINARLAAERDEYRKAADDMAAAHKVERDAWGKAELPMLPDFRYAGQDGALWDRLSMEAYGQQCAVHAREMAISETVSIAYGYADNLTWDDGFKAEIKALKGK